MAIGNLDRRITIQEKVITTNDYGEEVVTWTDTTTVWASIKYKSGNERTSAEQLVAMNMVVFQVRYLSWLTEEHRIVYRDDNYDILWISEIARKKYMDIQAEKRDNNL